MPETAFLITIDTEGDDLWAQPHEITTHNARHLPRFQTLCERFGFKPTYLTNYEMAMSDAFVEFARDALSRGTAEIGMHLHAWNTPPLEPLTADDFRFQPYLIEYPRSVMREKIRTLTGLLEERFQRKTVSHRAGRWAFDGRYAELLIEQGYRADCSVTPETNWRSVRGDPAGSGGSDYTGFPGRAYFLDPADISRPAPTGELLEVPMTVRASRLYRAAPWAYRIPLVRRYANRLSLGLGWLCPVQPTISAPLERHLAAMLDVASAVRSTGIDYVEFMLHSSELMPGGSPKFRRSEDIELLYEQLEILFGEIAAWCSGMTLREFREAARARLPPQHDPLFGPEPQPPPRLELDGPR